MTIAGKISLGGSVGLSLATAALAFMVMGTKNRFSQQLVAVESSLRDGKFTTLGLPYTGNFMENEAEPAATVAQAGQKWDLTAIDLKTSRTQEEATKVEEELKKLRTEVEMTKPGSTKSIALSGKIVAVNPTWNFVIIDLGKNDSVVEGLTMVLYRGDKMIGKVKTVTVDAQTSVADVLPGTPASAIEIGDQVVY